MNDYLESIKKRDPAAKSILSIILTYPGVKAVLLHRVANFFHIAGFHLIARIISQTSRFFTGIEIHPGAKIGKNLFIDHGMGVVIGETSEVGDDVTLYQGVTLGGTSLEKGKRHPTLGNGVIVGSGAQILGPITVSDAARVGANAVVLQDVPLGATVVGIPAKIVMGRDKSLDDEFCAYGTPTEGLPDPIARSFESLRNQLNFLGEKIIQLEREVAENKRFEESNEEPNESKDRNAI